MKSPVLIGGFEKTGKTSFIRALLRIAAQKKLNYAAFKPFDTGILKLNAEEMQSDAELICLDMKGNPMETLVTPYFANEAYPIELSFRRDGIKIKETYIQERLKILDDLYDYTLVELPPSLFMPVTDKVMVCDWIKELGSPLVWLIHPLDEQFTHNLAEIHFLKSLGIDFHLVLNNVSGIRDQDLLFYIWEKIEAFADQEFAGMIPYIKEIDSSLENFEKGVAENIPKLLDELIKISS